MNNEQKIQKLEREVADLLAWKASKEKQQITFPLDDASRNVLSKYFLTYISNLDFVSASGQVFPNILIGYNGVKSLIAVTNNLFQFTANATSNVLTLNNPNAFYNDGDQIVLYTTDTLPAPLSDVAPYYVVNASGNTFKLEATLGGGAIDITTTGTGAHFSLFFT